MNECWINYSAACDFSIHNLPYGIFSTEVNSSPRAGIAIGDQIIDLPALLRDEQVFKALDIDPQILSGSVLNDFISLGAKVHSRLRRFLQSELVDSSSRLKELNIFTPQSSAIMHMPVSVGDYTDFYSSRDHATNVGKMFRDPENALLPNWLHIPVGYHGRASSIVVSGTDLHRPCGQTLPKGADVPTFGPCRLLDFELEMACVIGRDSTLGTAVSTDQAEDYIFGLVIFNDWSARDIQKWEYVPLGPFLGKNWGSSISPWIVPLDALEDFRLDGPQQELAVLPYLRYTGKKRFDLNLEVAIKPEDGTETCIVESNFKYMYWNMSQQIAHHTVNGCNLRVGDMLASGTISGPNQKSFGSMLEQSWAGAREIELSDGQTRKFIHDGDEVIMRAFAQKHHKRIGFGEVRTKILPALETT